MATLFLTSSDSFLDHDDHAAERETIEVSNYIEGTYDCLRRGPNGEEIARLVNGAWELPDGRRFSDWAVEVRR